MTHNIDTPSQCAPLHNQGCLKRWSNTYIFVWLDDSLCDTLYVPVYMHLVCSCTPGGPCNGTELGVFLGWSPPYILRHGQYSSESGIHLSPTATGFLLRLLSLLPWAVITGWLLCPPKPLCVLLGSELRSSSLHDKHFTQPSFQSLK